jgi:protein O-GlcNAc transferase
MSTVLERQISILLQKELYEQLFELGTALAGQQDYSKAEACLAAVRNRLPDDVNLISNHAFVLTKLGRQSEALVRYRQLLQVCPGHLNGALGCAGLLEQQHHYAMAVMVIRAAILANPEESGLMTGLGNALIMTGNAAAALAWYALALESGNRERTTISNFLYVLLMVDGILPDIVASELELLAGHPQLAFKFNMACRRFIGGIDSRLVADLHRQYGSFIQLPMVQGWQDNKSENHRSRIGYLSADLYAHPVGYFLEGVLPNHDRQRWEVIVFCPYSERDSVTERLYGAAEHWVVLEEKNREKMLQQIRACKLDIAVDMAGHTGGNYLDLFSAGIAPVQVTWGGYPGTTGLSTMHGIIADPVALPSSDERYYTERPIHLPDCYVSWQPPSGLPAPSRLPASVSGRITFAAFSTIQKLTSSTIRLWARVLQAVPESQLLMKGKGLSDPQVCAELISRFKIEGIVSSRIICEGHSPHRELLLAYERVDVALDPVPYQGGVTVLEAIWMGVPTLVMRGHRPPFIRHGESHLVNAGLSEWIAESEADYVDKAVAWSQRLPQLAVLRCRLRQQLANSPICDHPQFVRDLEAALERFILEEKAS